MPAPTAGIVRRSAGRRGRAQRREGARHRLRAGRRGLGLGRRRRARGHQRARRGGPEGHARAAARATSPASTREAVAFDPRNDIAVLRVRGLQAPALALADSPRTGTSAAVLGFPRNGPYDERAGRLGDDARGRHPGRLRPRAGAARRSPRCAAPCAPATPAGRWSTAAAGWSRRSSPPPRPGRAAATACRTPSCAARSTRRARAGVAPVPARSRARERRAARYPRPPWPRPSSSPRSPPSGGTSPGPCPGQFAKHEGYLESDAHVVTWAVGHLVQLAEPDEYDAKYKKWRMADLPIVPDRFKLVVRDERSRKQMTVDHAAAEARGRRRRSSTPATPAARAS